MSDYNELLKNNIDEKTRLKKEIKKLNDDMFTYQNRGDRSSFLTCRDRIKYLRSNLDAIEKEIIRLEKLIKNGEQETGLALNKNNQIKGASIDNGDITTTVKMEVNIQGTKGKGNKKRYVHKKDTQIIQRNTNIKNGHINSQTTHVDTISSTKNIKKTSSNVIGGSSKQGFVKPKPQRKKSNSKNKYVKPLRKKVKPPKRRYSPNLNKNNERRDMDSFLSYLKKRFDWNQAAEFSNISPDKAMNWYVLGSHNHSINTTYFHDEINKINYCSQGSEIIDVRVVKPEKHSDSSSKVNSFKPVHSINYKKINANVSSESSDIKKDKKKNSSNHSDIKKQIKHKELFKNSKFATQSKTNSQSSVYSIDFEKRKMNFVLFNLKEGKSIEKAAESANVTTDLINQWIIKGGKGNINYIDFYNEYMSIQDISNVVEEKNNFDIQKNQQEDTQFKVNNSADVNRNQLDLKIKDRINRMDLIENEFNKLNSELLKVEKLNVSRNSKKTKLTNLIQKFESKKDQVEKEIKINEEIILGYGYSDSHNIHDYQNKRIEFKDELLDIDNEIKRAGFKNDFALVKELQNRKSRLKTKLNEIENILVLLNKQEKITKDIPKINLKIKKIEQQLADMENERKEMDGFLYAYRYAKSCREAAKSVGIEVQRIVNWLHEGRDNTSENKIYFHKEFYIIKNKKDRTRRAIKQRELKRKRISQLLNQLRNGKTRKQSCETVGISIKEFNRWYKSGKLGKDDENIKFYMQVKEIELMNDFLREYRKTKSIKSTIKNNSITVNQYEKWCRQGKEKSRENSIYFVNELERIKQEINTPPKPKTTTFEKNQRIKMDNVLQKMKNGFSRGDAAIKSKFPESTVEKWYNQGKEKFSKNTIYFYNQVNLIEGNNDEIENMNNVLDGLKNGKNLEDIVKSIGITADIVNTWFDDGKQGLNQNTIYFYNEMVNIKNNQEFNKMGIVLEAIINGNDRFKACEIAGINISKLNSWINQGNNNENKNAIYFVAELEKIETDDPYIPIKTRKSNTNFCSECGKKVETGDNFCRKCGAPIGDNKKRKKGFFDKIRSLF